MTICPHCKKPLEHKVTRKALKRAEQLYKEGFSLRAIEKIIFSEGMQASLSTLSRQAVNWSKKK
jgi:hypothetical protein